MKHDQQQKAREMYFQSNLTKTEIAEKIGVSRRSVFQWSVSGDWEKLRNSARCMPALLAEKCYYLIGHFTDHLLSKESFYQSVTKQDADILFKLTKTINLLKKGSTVNESMETFTHFLEGLQATDPALADAVIPHVDSFITARSASSVISAPLNGFTPQGFKPFPEKEIMEKWQDEKDAADLAAEGWYPGAPLTGTTAAPVTPQPAPPHAAHAATPQAPEAHNTTTYTTPAEPVTPPLKNIFTKKQRKQNRQSTMRPTPHTHAA